VWHVGTPTHTQFSQNPTWYHPNKVKQHILLSADDSQAHRALTLEGCSIECINVLKYNLLLVNHFPVTNVDKMNPKSDSNEGMIQFNITIYVNKYYQLVKCITA
jgi:hypothetical protein